MKILRWLLVLPGALGAVFLAALAVWFLVLLVFSTAGTDHENPMIIFFTPTMLRRWGYAFTYPLAFVVVGVRIAPAHKNAVAVTLSVLFLALLGVGVASVKTPFGENVVAVTLAALGTLFALRVAWEPTSSEWGTDPEDAPAALPSGPSPDHPARSR